METFIIRKSDKEWRITGEGLFCGKRVKPGRLDETEMIDDPKMIKVNDEAGKSIFVLMVSNAEDVTVERGSDEKVAKPDVVRAGVGAGARSARPSRGRGAAPAQAPGRNDSRVG